MLIFGAEALREATQRLETMGQKNDLAQAADACAAVEQELDLVRQELTALLEETG